MLRFWTQELHRDKSQRPERVPLRVHDDWLDPGRRQEGDSSTTRQTSRLGQIDPLRCAFHDAAATGGRPPMLEATKKIQDIGSQSRSPLVGRDLQNGTHGFLSRPAIIMRFLSSHNILRPQIERRNERGGALGDCGSLVEMPYN